MTTEEMLEDVHKEVVDNRPYSTGTALGNMDSYGVYIREVMGRRFLQQFWKPRLNTFHFNINEEGTAIHFIPTFSGCDGLDSEQKRELTCLCWHKTGEDEWERGEPHKVMDCGH